MEIINNKVEAPGDYVIPKTGQQVIVVKDTEKVNLIGEGCYIDGTSFKEPNIRLKNSKNVSISGKGSSGIVMTSTRIMCQEYSSNLTVENVLFINSHGSCISAKTEHHIDAKRYPDINYSDFEIDYINIENVSSVNASEELIYIGSNKPVHHYIKQVTVKKANASYCGREGAQFSHVKNLYVNELDIFKSGQKNIQYQTNGLQVQDCNGIIRKATINHTKENGLVNMSFGMTYTNLKISNCPLNAIFIGETTKRYPYSPLNTGKPLLFIEPEIDSCKYAFNIQTDEMKVYIINPKITNVESVFHPRSARANVEIINEPLLTC